MEAERDCVSKLRSSSLGMLSVSAAIGELVVVAIG